MQASQQKPASNAPTTQNPRVRPTPLLKNHFQTDDKENQPSSSKRLSIDFANSAQREQIRSLVKSQKQETEKRLSVDFNTAANETRSSQKERIKELLRLQKQEHEKKIRTNNRLNQILEKRIDKIESLMQTSHGDSLLADSVFQPNTTVAMSELSVLEKSQAFKSLLDVKENSFPFSGDVTRSPAKRCLVEVINLQNTTVHRQPDGVLVVKESERQDRVSYLGVINRPISAVKKVKSEAWFLPVTPKVEGKPEIEKNAAILKLY